ncbi:ABC transporter ATP-binding protein [Microbacterium suaedae]|nr:ABC transporter ATP-binding protein [Microbacterium suaedae]
MDQITAPEKHASVTLRMRDVGVTYRTPAGSKEVLSAINLDVRQGEFVCIVGPSGTGKTTLIRCIAGLMSTTAGSVELDEQTVSGPPVNLALVSQDYSRSLMPWLRIDDNVALPLRGKGIKRHEIDRRVASALSAVNLTNAARAYPWQLSGGMQQRAAIARALAYGPEVMVLDEPFASVDAQTRAELEDLMRTLQSENGMTVLLVTHDIDESVYLADRVVVLGGSPATVHTELDIELGDSRDHLATKALPEFTRYRSEILACIRSARLDAGAQ